MSNLSDVRKISLAEAFNKFDQAWSPKLVGGVNEVDVKLAKFRGEFTWHAHACEDEMFLVIAGEMKMQFRDPNGRENHEIVKAGEMIVIPCGVQHCPASVGDECQVLMVEPRSTINTGDGDATDRTVREIDDLR